MSLLRGKKEPFKSKLICENKTSQGGMTKGTKGKVFPCVRGPGLLVPFQATKQV